MNSQEENSLKKAKKRLIWVTVHCRRGKDFLSVQSFKKHPLVKDALFFTEEGVSSNQNPKAKNLWPGIIFVQTEIVGGQISKELKDFFFLNPYFARFYTHKRTYLGDPILLSEREIKRIVQRLQSAQKPTKGKFNPEDIDFQVNEFVTVLSGVFRGYEGEVVEIDYNTGIVTLSIEFFGRITPIQVGFLECKKIT